MRRCCWRGLVGPLLALGVALPAAYGLALPGLPETADGIGHLSLLVAFDRALRAGALYPAWLPDYYLGYGGPVFVFYSPAAFYLAEVFRLAGAGFGASIKCMYLATLLLSGLGAYLLARSLLGSLPAALLAAVAYVYAPYHLVDVYARGAIAESLAYALAPFPLWALHRLAAQCTPRGTRRWTAAAALLLASVVLAHQLTAMFLFPLALAFALLAAPNRARRLWALGALALALLVSAGYWVPAMVEQPFAHVQDFTTEGGQVWMFLAPLAALQQWTPAAVYDYRLGLLQTTLALAGLATLTWQRFPRRLTWALPVTCHPLWLMPVVAAVCVFFNTPWSRGLWLVIPGIRYTRYPFRLWLFVALAGALLAGCLACRGRLRWPIAILCGLALTWSVFPNLPVKRVALDERSLGVATLERYLYGRGPEDSATNDEYVPAQAPKAMLQLADGRPLEVRLPGTSAIEHVTIARWSPWTWQGAVSSRGPGALRFHTFFYLGWQAWVDGRPARVTAAAPLGLLEVEVPDGEHAFEARWGGWWGRDAAGVGTLLGLLVVAWLGGLRGWPRWAALLAAAAVLVAAGVVQRGGVRVPTQAPPSAGPLALVADDVEPAGDGALVTLYWLARRPPGTLEIELRLLDSAGRAVGELREPPGFGASPATLWMAGEVVRDSHLLPAAPEATRLAVRALRGGQEVAGAEVALAAVPTGRDAHAPDGWRPVGTGLGGRMARLVGYADGWSGAPPAPDGGRYLAVRLAWECLRRPDKNYSSFVELVDGAGRAVAERDYYPQGGMRPTLSWLPGQRIEDELLLHVPGGVAHGEYRLRAGLYRWGGERLRVDGSEETAVALGTVAV